MISDNTRPPFDPEIQAIAQYVSDYTVTSPLALETARYVLLDSVACALMALQYPSCTRLLGPLVPGATLEGGARVIGSSDQFDPVRAAFNLGALIRWLDFNDTWLAAEWGHPSDNVGGILATADYLSRQAIKNKRSPLLLKDLLPLMVKAHEIQGVIALENSFNRVGLDHVILVKVASTAVVTHLLGGDATQLCHALSLAFVDGQSLRTYRHAPNTGSRKSWAAGDATSRAVYLALMVLRGEMGYPSALSAPRWGFYAVHFNQKPFVMNRPYESYVMENVLFKISFPAEFHAQTAVEAAIQLHPQVKARFSEIDQILVKTQESAIRIIDKKGKLYNPADRDHCLQYMIAIGLIYGDLTADHYEDHTAQNPLIDQLREKMLVCEEPRFTKEYLDPQKRSIGNAIQVIFKDGQKTEEISVDYPIGHRLRRAAGIPLLRDKFEKAVTHHFDPKRAEKILKKTAAPSEMDAMPVNEFMDLLQ